MRRGLLHPLDYIIYNHDYIAFFLKKKPKQCTSIFIFILMLVDVVGPALVSS